MSSYLMLTTNIIKLFPILSDKKFVISWKDEDGDIVKLSSDEELNDSIVNQSREGNNVYKFDITTITTTTATAVNMTSIISSNDDYSCDGCGMYPIHGIRYKCTKRNDFNLCESCESISKQPYPMIKIYHPNQRHLASMISVSLPDKNRENHRGQLTKSKQNKTSSFPLLSTVLSKSERLNPKFDVQASGVSSSIAVTTATTATISTTSSSNTNTNDKLKCCFVGDVTYVDGTTVKLGSEFMKIWRCRNDGKIDWPVGCNLLPVSGDSLCSPDTRVQIPPVKSNEEIDISILLKAPFSTGRYIGYFRLQNPEGKFFGQRLWAGIQVVDDTEQDYPNDRNFIDKSLPVISNISSSSSSSSSERVWEIPSSSLTLSSNNEISSGISTFTDISNLENTMLVNSTMLNSSNFVEVDDSNIMNSETESATATVIGTAIGTDTAITSAVSTQSSETNNSMISWAQVYEAELRVLRDMGFDNTSVIIPLLREYLPQKTLTSFSNQSQESHTQSIEIMQRIVLELLA